MGRIIKYNSSKSSDSKRVNGSVGNIIISGIKTEDKTTQNENTSSQATLNRIIWGEIDNGGDLNGDIFVGGNGYIIDTTNDDPPRTLADMDFFEDGDEGNLYVEKGIKGDNITVNSTNTNEIYSESGNIDNIYTSFLNAAEGVIANLSGNQLNFIEGLINNLVSDNITTEYLTVTKQAHFFELVIDKIKAAGGAVILSPADGFKVDEVIHVGNGYRLLFRCEQENKKVYNMWEIGDQAICQTFNVAEGVNYNISNKYYWAEVIDVGSNILYNNENYHYITLSLTNYVGVLKPKIGDEIAMLGHRGTNTARQSAIYLSAYNSIDKTLQAPLFCHYKGIKDFNLSNCKYTWFAANGNTIRGNLLVESGETLEDVVDKVSSGFESSVVEYNYSVSGNIPPVNGWTLYIPEVPQGYYLWTRTTTTYKGGYKTESYSVSKNAENTVVYKLIPDKEFAIIDEFGNLVVNFQYNLVKITGDNIVQVNPRDIDLQVFFSNDLDYGDYVYLDDDLYYYNGDFLHRTYNGNKDYCPSNFVVFLSTSDSAVLYEKRIIPVQFSTFSILEINNGIRTEVREISGRTSRMEQLADKFEFDIYDADGEIKSQIKQTIDEIKLQVDKISLEISNRKIVLNGDTEINGNLVLNGNEQGFVLNGSNGQTLIAPQSISTFENFKNQTTRNINIKSKEHEEFLTSTKISSTITDILNIGHLESNIYCDFLLNSIGKRWINSNEYRNGTTNYKSIKIYRNGSLQYNSTNLSTHFQWRTPVEGDYTIEITYNVDFSSINTNYNNVVIMQSEVRCNVPITNVFTLIGNDGIATTFGNGKYLFFGKDESQILYGDYGLKITNQGLQKCINGVWSSL